MHLYSDLTLIIMMARFCSIQDSCCHIEQASRPLNTFERPFNSSSGVSRLASPIRNWMKDSFQGFVRSCGSCSCAPSSTDLCTKATHHHNTCLRGE